MPPTFHFCIRNGSISFWQAESSWQKQTTVLMLLCYTVMGSLLTVRQPPLNLSSKLTNNTKCIYNIIFRWKLATNKNNKAIYRTLQKEQRENSGFSWYYRYTKLQNDYNTNAKVKSINMHTNKRAFFMKIHKLKAQRFEYRVNELNWVCLLLVMLHIG